MKLVTFFGFAEVRLIYLFHLLDYLLLQKLVSQYQLISLLFEHLHLLQLL